MKNRNLILTTILPFLGCGGLSCSALAAGVAPSDVNVVNNARNAVQQDFSISLPGRGPSSVTIPVGKIFVLEFVSFETVVSSGETLNFLIIAVNGPKIDGTRGLIAYPMAIPPPSANGIYSGSQALRLYAQPGTTLTVEAGASGGSTTQLIVSLSGYFVDAQ